MISRRQLLTTLIASAAALPLAACGSGSEVKKRIKIIAMAEVDGKRVEGTSVMEITWRPRGDGGMNVDHLGEAVVLELAGRGTVYVLFSVYHPNGMTNSGIWANQITYVLGISGATVEGDLVSIKKLQGRYPFKTTPSGATFPLMVAFKDENEFRSVYRAEPEKFSQYFGTDVKFVGVDFEITDEPVTQGIVAKRLPILLRHGGNAPDSEVKDSSGKRLAYVDKPFKYKIGTKTFFARGRR